MSLKDKNRMELLQMVMILIRDRDHEQVRNYIKKKFGTRMLNKLETEHIRELILDIQKGAFVWT